MPGTETTAPAQTPATPDEFATVSRFIELGWGGDPDGAMAMVDLDPDLLGITTNSLPFRRTILDLTSPATEAEEGEESSVDEDFFRSFDPVPKDVAETMIGAVLGAATTLDTSVTDIDCTLETSFEELAAFTSTFVACTARVESRLTSVLPAIPAPSSEGEDADLPDHVRWFAFVADAGKVTGVVALPSWFTAVDVADELTPYAERFAGLEKDLECQPTLESVGSCVGFWLTIADGYGRIRDVVYEPFQITDGDLRFVFSEFFWAESDERSTVIIYENGVLIGGGTMYNLYGEGSDPADHYIFWDPAAARDVPLALRDRTVVLRGSVLDAAMAALLES